MSETQRDATETADRVLRIWDSPRERVMYDADYFMESLVLIVDKDSNTIPFTLNSIQRQYSIQKTFRDVILKGRQHGMSTYLESLFLHDTMFNHNTQSVLLAHTEQAATLMFQRCKFMFEHLPERFKPHVKFSNRRELHFDNINSSFFIGSAEQRDFGRGLTINNLHISECGSPVFKEELFTGLLEAVPRSGRIVLESTAQGEGGPFYEFYMGARNLIAPHRPVKNNFTAHYFPWYINPEYKEPILRGETLSYTEEELRLITRLALTPEQIKWRRMKKAIQGNKFVQEYPEDNDEDAFLKSGSPIFDNYLLSEIDKTLPEQRPDEIWLGGDLFVHRMAERGAKYIIGADPAEGDPRSDFSAAIVIRVNPYPIEQVALLVGLFTPDMLSEKIWKIGKAYNGAMIAVERNNHGHAVINQLTNGIVRRGVMKHPPYDNLYVGPDKKVGWLTTNITKPQMIDELDRAIRGGEIIIKNKRFISEAKKFTHLDHNKMGGKPDDVVMCQAVALMAAIAGRFQWSM